MARPQRVLYENAYYHVMNRGAGRQNIFYDDKDRALFLRTVEETCQQYHTEIHAYCLMSNHYHLLIKTPNANLSRAMRHINGVYTQRYNRRNKTDGPLFRGRYKAILVDSDSYLLHLSKYIHLNPTAAKLVNSLDLYKWSSYLAYIGKVKQPAWLRLEEVYAQLTQETEDAAKFTHYKSFMDNDDLNEQLTLFYSQGHTSPVLGDDAFLDSLCLNKPSQETPKKQRVISKPEINKIILETAKVFRVNPESLVTLQKGRQPKNLARKAALYFANKHGGYQLSELATIFGFKNYGGVSHAIHTFSQEVKRDSERKKQLDRIVEKMKTDLTP